MLNPITNKIHFAIILLLASFPLWNAKLIPILLIIWLTSNLIYGISQYRNVKLGSIKPLLIQSSLFILIFIYTIFIDKSKEAHFFLERSLSLIIFPIGFYFNPIQFSSKQLNSIKLTFSAASLLIVLICSILAITDLLKNYGDILPHNNIGELMHHPEFQFYFRRTFEHFSELHPTYASMYLGLSTIFILDLLILNLSIWSKKLIVIGFLAIGLILLLIAFLASRTPFAATILVSILLVFMRLKKKIYILYALATALLLSVMLYFSVPSFSARLSQISISNTSIPNESGVGDSFNMRSGILHCSLELIQQNWLMGVGPGKAQEKLDNCYMEIAPKIYEGFHFNTHNQFLGYWLEIGILGILTLFFILFTISVQGIKTHNLMSLFICIFFAICFLTENIMVRQQGIVTVAFFLNLFYFIDYKVKLNNESNL